MKPIKHLQETLTYLQETLNISPGNPSHISTKPINISAGNPSHLQETHHISPGNP